MHVKKQFQSGVLLLALGLVVVGAHGERPMDQALDYPGIKNVTLEMSLKPFKNMDDTYIEETCGELFRQWWPLTRHTDGVSVLLWTADGSEILTYKGDLSEEIEWGRYIGGANSKVAVGSGPEHLSLHQRAFLYMENPPEITYGNLKRIVAVLKRVGVEITGKPVRVGATFDPGPEFADSPFKYTLHPEICLGDTMGKGTMVCSYSVLKGDRERYAGFPEGIPEGTPFGTFFGRQCQYFLKDLSFDYLWLSNGFGFGLETWGCTVAVFDGEHFDTAGVSAVREKILDFWRLFRQECPEYLIETRGTNLSTGMDLSSDGVPLREIYQGDFNMFPPPNSPWAALDCNFGLELVGYMSHIAEIPGEEYPFRYYTHDPWWLNSPWLDRYGREPHDIYLPMSVSRIDAAGTVRLPSSILFLTADNSFGEMPVEVPNEVIPHILRGRADSPDQPGPVVWIYPFEEYHEMTFTESPRVQEVLFGDWFLCRAINIGFPVNTVVSTGNFLASRTARPNLYAESVLLSIVPDGGTVLEAGLLDTIKKGGRVLLYGPLDHAGKDLLDLLGVRLDTPQDGEFNLVTAMNLDHLTAEQWPTKIQHRSLTGGGPLRAIKQAEDAAVLASVSREAVNRVVAVSRALPEWNGGGLVWVRGINSNYYRKGARLLLNDDPATWFQGELLMRFALHVFGYDFVVTKRLAEQPNPLVCVARKHNGFFFSGYSPDTTVSERFRFPQGAPVLIGYETWLDEGCSTYTMPRAWHRECRVFIDGQKDGKLSCREAHSGHYGVQRRLQVAGLEDATLRFYPDTSCDVNNVRIAVNSNYPYDAGKIKLKEGDPKYGRHFIVENVTGQVNIAW
ncbi:MAG: hypothetical protein BWY09_00242 [Candidatus Hydrogenedentes bacterium ADurb.Bin179]|nr:MAG: hypothetical protein BWY09_00242 [Candidatus Hydrogenedentes bacterium ADurb.Bin179]